MVVVSSAFLLPVSTVRRRQPDIPGPHTRSLLFAAALWVAGGAVVGPAWADDVQVNTYTTGNQNFPSLSRSADGDLVVVWQSEMSGGTDSDDCSVQGQRYTSNGSILGSEFQVNTYTTSSQRNPSVSLDADGDFVVVWWSYGSDGTDSDDFSIQGQRYASNGSALGEQFQVNSYTTSYQTGPSVSLDADGDFVVVWQSDGSAGTDTSGYSIQGQRYASDGSTLGGQFQVNTYTTSGQFSSSVSLDADGDFVVVWASDAASGDSDDGSIQGQRYASDGSTLGGQFQVNSYTTSNQTQPSVSVDADGDFVVVWASIGSSDTDSDFSIQGQRYASNGSTQGSEFQVNTYTTSTQVYPWVSMDANGNFVVVWTNFAATGTDTSGSIQGQRYASDGSTVGGEFQINTYTTGSQRRPSVSLNTDRDFVAVWQSDGSAGTDTSVDSIQRSEIPFFRDGFESGDTLAWSATVP